MKKVFIKKDTTTALYEQPISLIPKILRHVSDGNYLML